MRIRNKLTIPPILFSLLFIEQKNMKWEQKNKKWEGVLGLISLQLLVTMGWGYEKQNSFQGCTGKGRKFTNSDKRGRPVEVAEMSHQPE